MNWAEIGWDLFKLVLQFGGALLIARWTVNWALDRFKNEKVWERQLAAQSDIIAALSDLRRVYGTWMDWEELGREASDEQEAEQAQQFKAASRRLEEAQALGILLLPKIITGRLAALETAREKAFDPEDRHGTYGTHYSLIDDAILELAQIGQETLPKVR